MSSKDNKLICVFLALTLIPQIVFFWINPSEADACGTVYLCGTALTAVTQATVFLACKFGEKDRATTMAIIAAVMEMGTMALWVFMLLINVSVRSALYMFAVVVLVYIGVLGPMAHDALRPDERA